MTLLKNARGQVTIIFVMIALVVVGFYVSQVSTIQRTSMGQRIEAREDLQASEILENLAETLRIARDLDRTNSCPGARTQIGPAFFCLPTDTATQCVRDPMNPSRTNLCFDATPSTLNNRIDFVLNKKSILPETERPFEFDLDLNFDAIPKAYAQVDPTLPVLTGVTTHRVTPAPTNQNCTATLNCVTLRICFAKDCGQAGARIYYQTIGFNP